MANDSVETWRLYQAEAATDPGEYLPDLDAVKTLVGDIQNSSWWRDNVTDTQVNIELNGHDEGGFNNSWTQQLDDPPTAWTISMHPQRLYVMEILHELAHTISPRWAYAGPTPEGTKPAHRELTHHGAEYAATRVALAERFGPPGPVEELKDNYAHFGVVIPTADEMRAAHESSRQAEEDMVRIRDSHPEGRILLAMMRRHGNSTPADLGPTLYVARVNARLEDGSRVTQAWVAEQVSQVVPCSARQVATVESLEGPPRSKRTYQVARCMAVLFNVDPIKAVYQLGLNRPHWELPLEDLAVLNQSWAALLAELVDLAEARPPRWEQ